MVNTYKKWMSPEIWVPMLDGLHHADELSLICRQLRVPLCDGPAEESHRSGALVEYNTEPVVGGVALDYEILVERWQLEDER
jgi:hypothetical protein